MNKSFIAISFFLGINILGGTSIDVVFNTTENSIQIDNNRSTDSLELVRFYELTGGENWIQKWDFEEPINHWFGVGLNRNGRVKCLDLDGDDNCDSEKNMGNNLTGNIPDLQLPLLEFLFLAGNNLTGSIPDFSGIPNLLMAQLCCNKFSGKIPSFTNLKNLTSLELDYNQLEGSVPNFSKTPQLENLYLSDNRLTGSLPAFQFLKKLKRLYVQNNMLEGRIPLLQRNHLIEQIIVGHNNFEGNIPSFKKHKNLSRINFSNNQFKGGIPNWEHLGKLRELDLANNYLIGTIPDFSKNKALKRLVLSNNQFENCSNISNLPYLKFFVLKGNRLTFEDLLPLKNVLLRDSFYSNQQPLVQDTIISFSEDENIVLDIPFDTKIASNKYRWFKSNRVVGTMSSLVLNPTLEDINGVYFCKITNPHLPGLELKIGDFILKSASQSRHLGIPFATDDLFDFVQNTNGKFQFNPVENDDLTDVKYWELEFLKHPKAGFIISKDDLGQYEINLPSNFVGDLEIEYQICNLEVPELCSVGLIELVITEKEENKTWHGFVTEVIAPYASNLPKTFIVDPKEENISKFSLTICNQLGEVVYHNIDYENTWEGTLHNTECLLSAGVYFYYLEFRNTNQVVSGPISIIY